VGVDGRSRPMTRCAAVGLQADLTGTSLEAVITRAGPLTPCRTSSPPLDEDIETPAKKTLNASLLSVFGEHEGLDVRTTVTRRLPRGRRDQAAQDLGGRFEMPWRLAAAIELFVGMRMRTRDIRNS
jgi:hypothetical protein